GRRRARRRWRGGPSSLWPRRDDLDRGADLVGDAQHAERHRRRGHPEITELPARVRGRGRGEIAAIALRGHVERHLVGLAFDRHVPGEGERERPARGERQGEPARLRRNEFGCWELTDLERVPFDEAVAVALVACERRE